TLRKFIIMTEQHEKTFKSLSEMRREEERLLNEIENRIKSRERKRHLRSAVENRVKILREFIRSMSPISEETDEETDEEDLNHLEDESNKREIRVTRLINEYRKASNKKHIGDTYRRVTTAFLIQKYPTSEPEKKRPQDAIQFYQDMRTQPEGLKDLPLYSQNQSIKIGITNQPSTNAMIKISI
ncbi:hypothetical protein ALC56_00937, partial [Trachymyrmex septentrionalis]